MARGNNDMKTNKSMRSALQRIKAGAVILSLVFGAGLIQGQALADETCTNGAKAAAAPADGKVRAVEVSLPVGRSCIEPIVTPFVRVSVGNPEVADILPIIPKQLYILGKKGGSTNVILWSKQDRIVAILNVNVSREFGALNAEIKKLAPAGNVTARSMGESIILEGRVPHAVMASKVISLAEAFVEGQKVKVVNMLTVEGVQQVLLEVKIAEINRTMGEKLGFDFARQFTGGGGTWTKIIGGIIGGGTGEFKKLDNVTLNTVVSFKGGHDQHVQTTLVETITAPLSQDFSSFLIDASKKDGLVKILAEPNIVAISGQEGSFLAGGEIMVPVPGPDGTTTLQSKLFGVGLSFTPTVLEDGRIHMRVVPEVTSLVGITPVATTGLGATTLVPVFTTRRVATTVELREGQSLAIGGLLTDTVRESIKRFPILGEIPILGALFRSSEYQTDKTELLIVVTPRLLKPLESDYQLPTDAFKEPSRSEFFLGGRMEGQQEAQQPAAAAPDAALPLDDGSGNTIQFGHQLEAPPPAAAPEEAARPLAAPQPAAAPDVARPLVDSSGNTIQFGHQLEAPPPAAAPEEAARPLAAPQPAAAPDVARPLVDSSGNTIQFGHQLK